MSDLIVAAVARRRKSTLWRA